MKTLRVPIMIAIAIAFATIVRAGPAIPLLPTDAAGFVGQAARGPLDRPVLVTSAEEFVATFGGFDGALDDPWLAPSAAAFFANGGRRLWVVRTAGADDASLIGTAGGPGARTGLQALLDVDEIATVAVPGVATPAVQTALIAHAAATGDRTAILDPARDDDLQAVVARREGLDDPDGRAALYFPWVVAAPDGVSRTLPPSGFAAGVFARSAPPASPLGTLATATGVSRDVTAADRDRLASLGIDAIRRLAGAGVQIETANTLASNGEWRDLASRRIADSLRESILAGTAWCLAQPNDAALWTTLRRDVADFLGDRYVDGWFAGASPGDSYFAHCDAATMTADDVDRGRTVLEIGFAPRAPAEFRILRLVQQRPQEAAAAPPSPSAARLDPPRPNPFNPSTTVRFTLPASATVELSVYDLGGRLVRTLIGGERLGPGPHLRRWDGRDDSGRPAGSGIYLVRLRAGNVTVMRRAVLAR